MTADSQDRYARIVDRVLVKAPAPLRRDASRLLAWIICAVRPMRWREIQGAVSIDLVDQTVNFEAQQLRNTAKELCGSLVEDRPDGSVILVHTTAKM